MLKSQEMVIIHFHSELEIVQIFIEILYLEK